MGVVYCATNQVNGKSYIGQTTKSLEERKRKHFIDIGKRNTYFSNALHKYGSNNFIWRVLFETNKKEELDERERYWIKAYNTFNKNEGYNMTSGGEGGTPSEETKQKLRKANSGINSYLFGRTGKNHPSFGLHISEKHKEKISKANKGENNYWYGKHHSDETKALISKTKKNGPNYNKKGKDCTSSKKIICVETGEVFDAIMDVQRKYGYNNSHISQCCQNKIKVSYGYHWKYVEKEN